MAASHKDVYLWDVYLRRSKQIRHADRFFRSVCVSCFILLECN